MTCQKCRQEWTISRVAHGAAGIAKVIVGIDKTPDDVEAHRLNQCANCDELRRVLSDMPKGADVMLGDTCRLCTCVIRAKVKIDSEVCPLEKW